MQLIFVFRDANFLLGSYVYIVNTYVQIIGVLLATIWCTGTRWYEEGDLGKERAFRTVKFAHSQNSTQTGSEIARDGIIPIYELKTKTDFQRGIDGSEGTSTIV